jgi:hypothetical protein
MIRMRAEDMVGLTLAVPCDDVTAPTPALHRNTTIGAETDGTVRSARGPTERSAGIAALSSPHNPTAYRSADTICLPSIDAATAHSHPLEFLSVDMVG